MWRKEAIPQELKDAYKIHLYKQKGNPQVCDNHRVISILSIAERYWPHSIDPPPVCTLIGLGLYQQVSVGTGKQRTIDIIFAARQFHQSVLVGFSVSMIAG